MVCDLLRAGVERFPRQQQGINFAAFGPPHVLFLYSQQLVNLFNLFLYPATHILLLLPG
jgi:hypothetical protein